MLHYQLTRTQLYLISTGVILLFCLLNRLNFWIGSEVATATVVSKQGWNSYENHRRSSSLVQKSHVTPILQFKQRSQLITAYGPTDMHVALGNEVKVIYKKKDPQNFYIYSFSGFWAIPLYYVFFPFLILTAATYSFLKPSYRLTTDFRQMLRIA